MRVLVTGGAGYIGSITSGVLAETGRQVTVLDSFEKGHRDAVEGFRVVEGDIRDRGFLAEVFEGADFDAVVHFAAYIEVGESVEQPLRYFRNNLVGGLNVLEAAIRAGVRKFVFSSTAAVYGTPLDVPISEDAPTAPINPYGLSKRDFEEILESCRRSYGLSYVSLRYFNAAGARPDGRHGEDHRPESHLIPRVLKAAVDGREVAIYGTDYPTPDGTCVRDYIHVLDLAQAHVLALESMDEGSGRGEVLNLGNGEGSSVREVINKACEVTGLDIPVREAPRRPGDASILVASAEKAKRVLGWRPELADLGTIIETAWRWHSSHPEGYEH